jgi:hypothetical protein
MGSTAIATTFEGKPVARFRHLRHTRYTQSGQTWETDTKEVLTAVAALWSESWIIQFELWGLGRGRADESGCITGGQLGNYHFSVQKGMG